MLRGQAASGLIINRKKRRCPGVAAFGLFGAASDVGVNGASLDCTEKKLYLHPQLTNE